VTDQADVRWSSHLHEEVDFWRQALSDPNEQMRGRAVRHELEDWVKREIDPAADPVRILDVGSGPLTTIGTTWQGKDLTVVALDPLADEYNEILDEIGLVAPAPPVPGRGEELIDMFGSDVFDFVLSANALDHCADPVRVVAEMVGVAKPGAMIFLHHLVDVAEHERHQGLHQWNLSPLPGDMTISGDDREVRLSEIAPGHHVDVEERGDDFVIRIRKSPTAL
jgi:SAM-dependent methyltransferase